MTVLLFKEITIAATAPGCSLGERADLPADSGRRNSSKTQVASVMRPGEWPLGTEEKSFSERAGMSPKISVIIATKNAAEGIASCIDSIINQTYRSYEILIQDALSVDRTLTIVRGYDPETVKVRSEPDAGIYDAWNRALARARGEWIIFLGADDRLAHSTVLDRRMQILARDPKEVDLLCGRIAFIGQKGRPQKQTGAPWNWPTMLRYQIVAHIGLMHHRRLFEKFGSFSTQYRISGDYEFLLRLGGQMNAIFMDDVEILAGAQGLSQRQVGRALIENFLIQRSRQDVGYALASGNLMVAGAKALYRRGRGLLF